MIRINESKDFEWFIDMLKGNKYSRVTSSWYEKKCYLNFESNKDVVVGVGYIFRGNNVIVRILIESTKVNIVTPPQSFREKLRKFNEKFCGGFMFKIKNKIGYSKLEIVDALAERTPPGIIYEMKLVDEDEIKFVYDYVGKYLFKFLKMAESEVKRGKGRM